MQGKLFDFHWVSSIYYYELTKLNMIPEIIDDILKDPIKAKLLILNGISIVNENYTWDKIVKNILTAVNAFKSETEE